MSSSSDVCFLLPVTDWQPDAEVALQAKAVSALEDGKVLLLPQLPFVMDAEEKSYLREDCLGRGSKSIKYFLRSDRLWGTAEKDQDSATLKRMLRRYALSAQELVTRLFPGYASGLVVGNTSFRPAEAHARVQSKRHDDRLLHVDAFPSRPSGGDRLLRVFTNIHPGAHVRTWRVGENFSDVALRFMPGITPPLPGSAMLLRLLKITKGLRTPYDHYMLHLHDAMKLDANYQAKVPGTKLEFAPGTSWIVFSDQVSHAAMSGQHALEQTFTLPVSVQSDPNTSPLRVLERLKRRKLA